MIEASTSSMLPPALVHAPTLVPSPVSPVANRSATAEGLASSALASLSASSWRRFVVPLADPMAPVDTPTSASDRTRPVEDIDPVTRLRKPMAMPRTPESPTRAPLVPPTGLAVSVSSLSARAL